MPKLSCTDWGKTGQGKVDIRHALAEFFGTAALVTIGSGAATTLTQTGAANVHTVGAAFGLTLTALMYSMSHTGASQFNPIVSVALMLCQHLSSAQCFLNIFFQCCGSMVGAFILSAFTNVGALAPNGTIDMTGALGANHKMSAAVTDEKALMAEIFGSFFLCMVFIHCICNNGKAGKVGTDAAPLACGFMYYALHLVIGPITGCGLNPARSTGPAAVSNVYLDQLWIFWVGPMIGGVVCGLLGRQIFMVDHEEEDRVAAYNAKEDAKEMAAKRLLQSKEGGGGGKDLRSAEVELVIHEGTHGHHHAIQGLADSLQEMRDEIHQLHENEKEMVLDTKGSE